MCSWGEEPTVAHLYKERDEYVEALEKAFTEGDLETAMQTAWKVIEIDRKVLNRALSEIPDETEFLNHARTFLNESVNWLAWQSYGQGDYDQALQLFQESLKLTTALHGKKDWRTVTVLIAIANTRERAGMSVQQLDRLAKADRLNDSVVQACRAGKDREVKELLEGKLAIHRKVLGSEHPATDYSLINLARFHEDNSNFEKAIVLFQESLEIRQEIYGSQHPITADALIELAKCYGKVGESEYGKALSLTQKCLEIRKQTLGQQHPEVATALLWLAAARSGMGEEQEAIVLLQQSLAIRRNALPPQHSDIIESLKCLAKIHHDMGNNTKALPLVQELCEILSEVKGEEAPETVSGRKFLAKLQKLLGI